MTFHLSPNLFLLIAINRQDTRQREKLFNFQQESSASRGAKGWKTTAEHGQVKARLKYLTKQNYAESALAKNLPKMENGKNAKAQADNGSDNEPEKKENSRTKK